MRDERGDVCQTEDWVWCFPVGDKREVAKKKKKKKKKNLCILCSPFQIAEAVVSSTSLCQSIKYTN
jgi:hypothetical protein